MGGGEVFGGRENTVVPDLIMESVSQTLASIEEMEAHLLLQPKCPLKNAAFPTTTSTLLTCTKSSLFFYAIGGSDIGFVWFNCWVLFFYNEVEVYWRASSQSSQFIIVFRRNFILAP
jgi:hypothetical protein